MGGRQIEPAEADTLLSTREIGPLDGFRSRIGRPFSAKIKLTDANAVEFDFGPRADADDGPAPDFSAQKPLGPCPKCGNRVFETPNAYVCERAVGEGRTCDFRSGRMILQRPIEPSQMSKLLETGKTDLLQFVSARADRSRVPRQAGGASGSRVRGQDPARVGAHAARQRAAARLAIIRAIASRSAELERMVRTSTTARRTRRCDRTGSFADLDDAIGSSTKGRAQSRARKPRRTRRRAGIGDRTPGDPTTRRTQAGETAPGRPREVGGEGCRWAASRGATKMPDVRSASGEPAGEGGDEAP